MKIRDRFSLLLLIGLLSFARAADLPEGPGLADRFPGDQNIASNPAVIFSEDFETKDYAARWDDVRNEGKRVLSLVDPALPVLGRHCLQVTADLESNTGGGLTKWFTSSETLFIRFYTKFDRECDYVHHFVTLRANRSLQGEGRWSGFGKAGLLPKGDDYFITALEPAGEWTKWPAPGHWNFYTYWPDMKKAPDGNYWGNSFKPDQQADIKKGEWICAEFMLKHNTPGKPDGEQAYWINGRRMGSWTGIKWRTVPELMANSLTLESYVTDMWTKHQINIVSFDNLVIAKEYIGPTR
ncbi:MAG: hypothetical protein ABI600_03010 [Luteolibacter sp.]